MEPILGPIRWGFRTELAVSIILSLFDSYFLSIKDVNTLLAWLPLQADALETIPTIAAKVVGRCEVDDGGSIEATLNVVVHIRYLLSSGGDNLAVSLDGE